MGYEPRGSRFRAPLLEAGPASRVLEISALTQPATVRWSRSAARSIWRTSPGSPEVRSACPCRRRGTCRLASSSGPGRKQSTKACDCPLRHSLDTQGSMSFIGVNDPHDADDRRQIQPLEAPPPRRVRGPSRRPPRRQRPARARPRGVGRQLARRGACRDREVAARRVRVASCAVRTRRLRGPDA